MTVSAAVLDKQYSRQKILQHQMNGSFEEDLCSSTQTLPKSWC